MSSDVKMKPFNSISTLTVEWEVSGQTIGTRHAEKTCSTRGPAAYQKDLPCRGRAESVKQVNIGDKNSWAQVYLGEFSMTGLPRFIVFPNQVD